MVETKQGTLTKIAILSINIPGMSSAGLSEADKDLMYQYLSSEMTSSNDLTLIGITDVPSINRNTITHITVTIAGSFMSGLKKLYFLLTLFNY